MPEPEPKKAVHNAGAFLAPYSAGSVPVPMRTLSDDYHDEPTEPEDSEPVADWDRHADRSDPVSAEWGLMDAPSSDS